MRAIQWSLAILACFAMVMSPSLGPCLGAEPAVAETPSARPTSAEETKSRAVDLSYVPASAVAAVIVHPQQVLAGENAELMPVEVITAAGLQNVGFDPLQIEEAIVVVAPPELPAPSSAGDSSALGRREPAPGFGAVLHFAGDYPRRDVFAKLKPMSPRIVEMNGKKVALIGGPMPVGIFMPDARTLVIGTDTLLRQMILSKDVDSKLTQLIRATDCSGTATALFSLDAVRGLVNQAIANAPPVPPPFADFLKIPKLVSSGVIKLDFRMPGECSATLHTADAASAEELQQLLERGIEMGRQMALADLAHEHPSSNDLVEQASQKYMTRITGRMFDLLKPKRDGEDVRWATHGTGGPAANVAVIGILIALLLPAVVAAREAARRSQSMNNLRQIGLSIVSYEEKYGHFPARAIFSKDGKPLLSWRVQILPFLDEMTLYNEFHLDEPWDSPHNKALIARMPRSFADPTDAVTGITHYVVPVGKGLMFDGDKGVSFRDITDGASNTILAVEGDTAVIWTKPEDLNVDLDKPMIGLGHVRPGFFSALFCDGHVSVFSDAIDPATLKAFFTIAGGELINLGALR